MPNITYNKDIPSAERSPALDQPNMKVNTNAVNTILDVDHYSFGVNSGGFHKKSTYIAAITGDPVAAPGSAAGQLVQYATTDAGSSELFFKRDGVATAIQMTRGVVSATGTASTAGTSGYTFLPGGILLQWGCIQTTGSAVGVVFPTTFTNLFSFSLTNINSASTTTTTVNITTGPLAVTVSGGSFPPLINYIAIGN